jgi:REP element-mobilizing transposase RayT
MEYAGAVYHVMARGNQGRPICDDEGDRKMWLATLVEACRRTGWQIHAWVLMSNHYHLLLETPEPNLVSGMKWLQGTYTQRYNARHRKRGHLFQGRYRAVPVQAEEPLYFQTVSTYIHLNPARAKLIRIGEEKLWQYGWSSYPSYVRQGAPAWLETGRVLASLRLKDSDRKGYEVYMETRCLELGQEAGRKEWEGLWRSLRRGWYVGGEEFRLGLLQKARRWLSGKGRAGRGGEVGRTHDQAQAQRLLAMGLRVVGLKPEELAGQPKGQMEKQLLAWWLRSQTTVPRSWIAEKLKMGYETRVSQATRWVESSRAHRLLALKAKLVATQ